MNTEEKIRMAEKLMPLLTSIKVNINESTKAIHNLNDLDINSTQDEINKHSIVYSLCVIKLQKAEDELKELRLIAISLGLYDTLVFMDTLNPIVQKLKEEIDSSLKLLSFISVLKL